MTLSRSDALHIRELAKKILGEMKQILRVFQIQ